MSICENLRGVLQGGKKGDPKERRGRTEVVHQMEVVSWNTGGVPGVYRFLELMELGRLEFDVLCVQAVRAGDEDIRVLEAMWSARGTTHTLSKAQRLKQSTDRFVTGEG